MISNIKNTLLIFCLFYVPSVYQVFCVKNCINVDTTLTQNIENYGFHRLMHWLIEIENDVNLIHGNCSFILFQEIPSGAYINPDQIADLIRVGKISARIQGSVDIEKPLHHSESHNLLVYFDTFKRRNDLDVPVHLRYQRPQLNGDYVKLELPYPSILFRCQNKVNICGNRVYLPINVTNEKEVLWKNISYKAISEPIEVMVPVGDLDHYPLVSITTFFVTCTGCIYLLSVILLRPLPTKL